MKTNIGMHGNLANKGETFLLNIQKVFSPPPSTFVILIYTVTTGVASTIMLGQVQGVPRIGFPFAKLLRNFCGTKRKIFLSLREKTSICAIIRKSHFAQNCPIPLLRKLEFCAIPQFCKNQTVGDGVCFLEFNSGKILFWNVFLLVTFT